MISICNRQSPLYTSLRIPGEPKQFKVLSYGKLYNLIRDRRTRVLREYFKNTHLCEHAGKTSTVVYNVLLREDHCIGLLKYIVYECGAKDDKSALRYAMRYKPYVYWDVCLDAAGIHTKDDKRHEIIKYFEFSDAKHAFKTVMGDSLSCNRKVLTQWAKVLTNRDPADIEDILSSHGISHFKRIPGFGGSEVGKSFVEYLVFDLRTNWGMNIALKVLSKYGDEWVDKNFDECMAFYMRLINCQPWTTSFMLILMNMIRMKILETLADMTQDDWKNGVYQSWFQFLPIDQYIVMLKMLSLED